MVGIAQLAEHLTVDQVVEGSSPFAHPRIYGTNREESPFLSIYGGIIFNRLIRTRVRVQLCAVLAELG